MASERVNPDSLDGDVQDRLKGGIERVDGRRPDAQTTGGKKTHAKPDLASMVMRLGRRRLSASETPREIETRREFDTDWPTLDRAHLTPGTKIGRFVLQDEVGRGGFGVVYRALDPSLNREVAIKIPRGDYLVGQIDRIHREAMIVATLEHPNIVRVYEAGTHNDNSFVASEFCDGPDLRTLLLANSDCLLPEQSAELIAQLASALAYAHQNGVVHRDVKPGNVLLFPANDAGPQVDRSKTVSLPFTPKLTDFGLASLESGDWSKTHTSVVIGTPMYMAPEWLAPGKDRPGMACDIYSLGTVLYELLAGKPPFEGEHFGQLLDDIVNVEPPHLASETVPRDLSIICEKCLSKAPEDRYQSAAELFDDLRRFQANEPILATKPTRKDRFAKWCRQPQRIVFAGKFSIWFQFFLLGWVIMQLIVIAALSLVEIELIYKSIVDVLTAGSMIHLPVALLGYWVVRGFRLAFWPAVLSSVFLAIFFITSPFVPTTFFDFHYPTPISKVSNFLLLIGASLANLMNHIFAIPAFLHGAKSRNS